jgi:POT family proton-dependent oligopeptide transporter
VNSADDGIVLTSTPGAATAPVAASGRTFLGHPAGLATLFFLEMWERMSFYGMRALLILYLVDPAARGGLGLNDRTAASIYGLYVGSTYIACLPGGWLGDRLLGAQRAVLFGGIIIALGHVTLGVAPGRDVFFLGLLVIAVGTGLLKTNSGSLVAQLYPEGGARRDAGFTLFYVGVNIGAFLGPLITGALALKYGWTTGFFAAAVGMTAGVIQFLWGRSLLGAAGRTPAGGRANPGSARAAGIGAAAAILLVALFWTGAIQVDPISLATITTQAVIGIAVLFFAYLLMGARLESAERQRVAVMIILFIASSLFWAGFEQVGSSLNLFAQRHTDRHILGLVVPAPWFQSLEAVFIIAFGSAFSALWMALGRRNRDPSTGAKFALGLLLMASAFVVMAMASRLVIGDRQVGMGWLCVSYLLITWGELALSPVGLSAVTKLVPQRFVGQSLGIFFVSLSLGNLLAGRIAAGFDPNNLAAMPGQFMFIFWFCSLCAIAVMLLLPLMRRWSQGVT